MSEFNFSVLPEQIIKSLSRQNITTPTPIQAQAIPLAIEGHDILASAQTGTGKTAAFAIPAIVKLLENQEHHVLILTPTREIATQVLKNVENLLDRTSPLRTCLIIGGEPMGKQLAILKRGCHIVVGTPGRINDHLRRGSLSLKKTKMLVLDETDRMLDMGFGIQIDEILDHMKSEKQTLLFSATIPPEIEKIAQKYLNDPQRISAGTANIAAPSIEQETIEVREADKYDTLLKTIQSNTSGSCVIFAKTQIGAEKLAERLDDDGFSTDLLHGGLRQNKRERVIKAFRSERFNILVATDIAARGLDIPHIRLVINYDLPQMAEDYIHRIGRTGRAGAEGRAVNLVSKGDMRKWRSIEILLNPELKKQRPSSVGGGERSRHSDSGFSQRPRRDSKPFGRSSSDGFSRDRKRGEGFSSDRNRSDAPPRRRSFSDSPSRGDESKGDRISFNRPERTDRDRSERPAFGNRDRAERGDRPAFGNRDRGERSAFGDRDRSERPAFNRSERSEGGYADRKPKSFGGDAGARSDRPRRDASDRGASSFGRSSGGGKPERFKSNDGPVRRESSPRPFRERSFKNAG